MEIETFYIDAFTSERFTGNPAMVCPLNRWLEADIMQKIAAEFAVSETAFIVGHDNTFKIRWFSPTVEIDLCGHATLATAHVLFNHKNCHSQVIEFTSMSGTLLVHKEGNLLQLDFPARPAAACPVPSGLEEALGHPFSEVQAVDRDYLVVYPSESIVRHLTPDTSLLEKLDKSVIVTAPGEKADFVSRYFAPLLGIPEDPVTGSAHCTLIPYWSKKLGKKEMKANQVSARGGTLYCRDEGDRMKIGGQAVTYLQGRIII
jgi:PhzF family phenazine biosynthesis protein